MTTNIEIEDETAEAIAQLGDTFDTPDDVLRRLLRDAGHGDLLHSQESPTMSTDPTPQETEATRQQLIDAWLDQAEENIEAQGSPFTRVPGRGGEDFIIDDEVIGKVRVSRAWEREDGRIWLRYDDELQWASHSEMEAVAVTLDIYDPSPTFSNEDHFFVLPEELIQSETTPSGNREFNPLGPGNYPTPLDRFADDWEGWY